MLDKDIREAIERAVEEEGQTVELANKIIKWIENLASGNEDMNDSEAYYRRCEICFNTMVITEDFEE